MTGSAEVLRFRKVANCDSENVEFDAGERFIRIGRLFDESF